MWAFIAVLHWWDGVSLPADYYTPRRPTYTAGPTLSPSYTVGATLTPTYTITH
jgi:hypothetical protein